VSHLGQALSLRGSLLWFVGGRGDGARFGAGALSRRDEDDGENMKGVEESIREERFRNERSRRSRGNGNDSDGPDRKPRKKRGSTEPKLNHSDFDYWQFIHDVPRLQALRAKYGAEEGGRVPRERYLEYVKEYDQYRRSLPRVKRVLYPTEEELRPLDELCREQGVDPDVAFSEVSLDLDGDNVTLKAGDRTILDGPLSDSDGESGSDSDGPLLFGEGYNSADDEFDVEEYVRDVRFLDRLLAGEDEETVLNEYEGLDEEGNRLDGEEEEGPEKEMTGSDLEAEEEMTMFMGSDSDSDADPEMDEDPLELGEEGGDRDRDMEGMDDGEEGEEGKEMGGTVDAIDLVLAQNHLWFRKLVKGKLDRDNDDDDDDEDGDDWGSDEEGPGSGEEGPGSGEEGEGEGSGSDSEGRGKLARKSRAVTEDKKKGKEGDGRKSSSSRGSSSDSDSDTDLSSDGDSEAEGEDHDENFKPDPALLEGLSEGEGASDLDEGGSDGSGSDGDSSGLSSDSDSDGDSDLEAYMHDTDRDVSSRRSKKVSGSVSGSDKSDGSGGENSSGSDSDDGAYLSDDYEGYGEFSGDSDREHDYSAEPFPAYADVERDPLDKFLVDGLLEAAKTKDHSYMTVLDAPIKRNRVTPPRSIAQLQAYCAPPKLRNSPNQGASAELAAEAWSVSPFPLHRPVRRYRY
jgi:hypothetical protein